MISFLPVTIIISTHPDLIGQCLPNQDDEKVVHWQNSHHDNSHHGTRFLSIAKKTSVILLLVDKQNGIFVCYCKHSRLYQASQNLFPKIF